MEPLRVRSKLREVTPQLLDHRFRPAGCDEEQGAIAWLECLVTDCHRSCLPVARKALHGDVPSSPRCESAVVLHGIPCPIPTGVEAAALTVRPDHQDGAVCI